MGDWGVTEYGFRRPSYAELLDSFERKAKELFGSDVNLSIRSVLGMMLRIFAWCTGLLWQLAEDVYNSAYIDTSTGVSLYRLGGIIGIRPYTAAKAVGELTFTGDEGITVPVGTIVAATNGTRFITLASGVIGSNNMVTVSAQAYEVGPDANVAAATITTIVTPVPDVDTVTNAAAFVGGRNRETEAEYRARYYRSVAKASGANTDAIREEILKVIGVQTAQVYANNTGEVDENGLPAHSVEAVVYGGQDIAVAAAIWKRKAAGVDTYGSTSASIVDAAGYTRQVNFSRPEAVPIWLQIANLQIKSGYDPQDAQDRLSAALIAYVTSLGVGVGAVYTQLIPVASAVDGVVDYTLSISDDGVTYGTANVPVSVRQTASTDGNKVVFV